MYALSRRTAAIPAVLALAVGAICAAPATGAPTPTRSTDYLGDGNDAFAVGGYDAQGRALVMLGLFEGQYLGFIQPQGPDTESGAPTFAAGDFDADGYDDLAIGYQYAVSPGAATDVRGGGVWIFHGTNGDLIDEGLTYPRISQATPGVPGAAEHEDRCGAALAAGDFDHDGYDDLAVGCPGENLGSLSAAGSAFVVSGGENGLEPAGAQALDQDTPGVHSRAEALDRFATSLASADVTGDGRDDLVIGVPGEGTGLVRSSHDWGQLHLVPGSSTGLKPASSTTFWSHDLGNNVTLGQQWPQQLGTSLATGDVDGDGVEDVVAGAPTTQAGSAGSGAVLVFKGSSKGLSSKPREVSQATSGVPGTSEYADWFGETLAVGDLTGDGRADVVVGAPYETVGKLRSAGAYTVLPGSSAGVTGKGAYAVTQDTTYVPGKAAADSYFSAYLTLSDVDDDGRLDVVVGLPTQDARPDVVGGQVDLLVSNARGRPGPMWAFVSGSTIDGNGPTSVTMLGTGAG